MFIISLDFIYITAADQLVQHSLWCPKEWKIMMRDGWESMRRGILLNEWMMMWCLMLMIIYTCDICGTRQNACEYSIQHLFRSKNSSEWIKNKMSFQMMSYNRRINNLNYCFYLILIYDFSLFMKEELVHKHIFFLFK